MTKMEQFAKALELAFELGQEIDGIETIRYHMTYTGTTEATRKIAHMVDESMEKTGLTVNKGVA